MMKKPKIKISLIDQKGHMGCHRGHQIGDTFDFDTERGNLCPMAMHVAFPYIDILRYGGKLPVLFHYFPSLQHLLSPSIFQTFQCLICTKINLMCWIFKFCQYPELFSGN